MGVHLCCAGSLTRWIVAEAAAANTTHSYASALRYWAGWHAARYGMSWRYRRPSDRAAVRGQPRCAVRPTARRPEGVAGVRIPLSHSEGGLLGRLLFWVIARQ